MLRPPEISPLGSPSYALELANTHLVHKGLWVSRSALLEHTPSPFQGPYENIYYSSHVGEVPNTSVALSYDMTPPPDVRLDAVSKGAGLAAVVAVTDDIAGRWRPNRTPGNTEQFWDGMINVFTNTASPEPVELDLTADGPLDHVGQLTAYSFAARVGDWLDIKPGERTAELREGFGRVKQQALRQLELSVSYEASPSPDALMAVAQETGAMVTDMGAVAFVDVERVGAERLQRVRSLARMIGAYGGIEEHGSKPDVAIERGIDTYVTALIRRHGALEGLRVAREMRRDAEADNRRAFKAMPTTKRERQIYDTVTFFARTASWFIPRRRAGLEARDLSPAARRLDALVEKTAAERDYPSSGAA